MAVGSIPGKLIVNSYFIFEANISARKFCCWPSAVLKEWKVLFWKELTEYLIIVFLHFWLH